MPIRPECKGLYPSNWDEISLSIKRTRARWRCECRGECGRPVAHRAADGRCRNVHGRPAHGTGSTVVLTCAHLNHDPRDCDPENLRAFCQGCHLHYDRAHHLETRRKTEVADQIAAGQETLFP